MEQGCSTTCRSFRRMTVGHMFNPKFASQCFHAPLLNALTVFSSPLYLSICPEGWGDKGCNECTQYHIAQEFIRSFQKSVPLSELVLSWVPCHHRMCLSRPGMVFAQWSGLQPASASTTVTV